MSITITGNHGITKKTDTHSRLQIRLLISNIKIRNENARKNIKYSNQKYLALKGLFGYFRISTIDLLTNFLLLLMIF